MSKGKSQTSIGRAFLSSPLTVVLLTAMVVVFGLSFAGYVRRGGFWSPEVEAQVVNEGWRGRRQGDQSGNGRRVFAFQGEVYEQAEQLREAGTLAMGTTLLAIRRSTERRPFTTVEGLLAGVIESGLLPPGLSRDRGRTSVSSEHAVYYIRYRAVPLGIEVLSLGKANPNGVAIVVRLPDDEFSENALTYYVVSKSGVEVPAAFAPAAQLIKAGWRPESFKATDVSPSEQEKQREWLAARAAEAK
jgi:hypothetical protein